jgi:uncharacterized membrane protein YeiB
VHLGHNEPIPETNLRIPGWVLISYADSLTDRDLSFVISKVFCLFSFASLFSFLFGDPYEFLSAAAWLF